VGCGWCCLDNPCEVSHQLYGYQRRCPDLAWDAALARYVCRLLDHPDRAVEFATALNLGQGCCAPLNSWRQDVRDRDRD
jgi:hypothetical protein